LCLNLCCSSFVLDLFAIFLPVSLWLSRALSFCNYSDLFPVFSWKLELLLISFLRYYSCIYSFFEKSNSGWISDLPHFSIFVNYAICCLLLIVNIWYYIIPVLWVREYSLILPFVMIKRIINPSFILWAERCEYITIIVNCIFVAWF